MDMDLTRTRNLLQTDGCTCVLCKDETVYKSDRRGVSPLMGWLESGTDLKGFSAADKVVGNATAFLYCLLEVKSVYAHVMSEAAARALEQQGIPFFYEQLVPAIQNRAGDGLCPMEQATRDLHDPADAPAAIRQVLANLTSKN